MTRFVHPATLLALLGGSAACGSSDNDDGDASTQDASVQCKVECDGDEVCSAAGKCVPKERDAAAPTLPEKKDGDSCAMNGSNCNPSCLESCGASSRCVDLCCTDTQASGVYCRGLCVAPKCKKGETSATWNGFTANGWTCFEVNVGGTKACDCTNGSTAAELRTQGKTIVPTCAGASCTYELDSYDLDCRCRSTSSSGLPPVPACTGPFTFSCDDPCVGFTIRSP